jgi:hypothetical protein
MSRGGDSPAQHASVRKLLATPSDTLHEVARTEGTDAYVVEA